VSEDFLQKIFNQDNNTTLSIDLEKQTITIDKTGEQEHFDINDYKKTCLLNGYSDIDYLLSIKDDIVNYEKQKAINV
jgi:3-isopropylmalate/(R)-2-methylmalate dehydratase small subunit